MPFVTISTWEDGLDEPTEARLIGAVTDAVAQSLGEDVRPHTVVVLHGIPRHRWGNGGQPAGRRADSEQS